MSANRSPWIGLSKVWHDCWVSRWNKFLSLRPSFPRRAREQGEEDSLRPFAYQLEMLRTVGFGHVEVAIALDRYRSVRFSRRGEFVERPFLPEKTIRSHKKSPICLPCVRVKPTAIMNCCIPKKYPSNNWLLHFSKFKTSLLNCQHLNLCSSA